MDWVRTALPYGHLSLTAGKNRFPVFAKRPWNVEYMLRLNNMVLIWQIRRQQTLTPENAPGSGMAGEFGTRLSGRCGSWLTRCGSPASGLPFSRRYPIGN
jgi:hypothetical protein